MNHGSGRSKTAPAKTGYRLETVSQAFARVQHGEDPWIAIGDFLDDWDLMGDGRVVEFTPWVSACEKSVLDGIQGAKGSRA